MTAPDFCSTPTGWSERDYDGHVEGTAPGMSYPHGFHDLYTGSCALRFHWPRAGVGGPTWAQIDNTGIAPVSQPSLDMDIQFERNSQGDFSWNVPILSIGVPSATDGFTTYPRIGIEFCGDENVSSLGRAYRGYFQNSAGTAFATAWRSMPFVNGTYGNTNNDNYHVYVSGSTGYMVLTKVADGSTVTETVALTGSFAGTYSRWSSYYNGVSGATHNGGDTHPTGTDKAAFGYINSLDPGWIVGARPVVGYIGFG